MSETLLVDSAGALRAAKAAFPRYAVSKPPTDLEPLRGLDVAIWFDDRAQSAALAGRLLALDCTVRVIEPNGSTLAMMGPDEARAYLAAHTIPVAPPSPPVDAPIVLPDTDAPVELIPGTDLANARRFVTRHGENVRFTPECGWLVWSGKHWQVDEKQLAASSLAIESAESLLDEIRTARDRNDAFKTAKLSCQKRAVEAAMWMARATVAERLLKYDVEPFILNTQNGIVDLTTGVLREHDKKARCTKIAGCDYADSPAPRFHQFIKEITCGDDELAAYLQQMCGYLMTASTEEHCLFFMIGGGRNGKSLLVETLMKIMGDYATASSPELIMVKKHATIPVDVAKLKGARASFMNETNQGQRFDEAKLKNLTGGDTLPARFMRENEFTFAPTHKLILRGQHKPTVCGTDEGIWSRLKLIPFNMNLTPDQIDRKLDTVLASELPGILYWCVQGCLAWQRHGMKTPSSVSQLVNAYRNQSDTMGVFLDERCDLAPNNKVKSGTLYEAYRSHCEKSGERWLSAKDFPDELERRGFKRERSNGVRWIYGIELRTQSDSWSHSGSD